MACLRPLVIAAALALAGCSDAGDPEDSSDGTDTGAEASASAGTPDPTITTTATASLTNGTSDSANDDAAATGSGDDAAENTGAADGTDGDDGVESSGSTAAGTTGTADPTGMDGSEGSGGGTTGGGTTPVGSECTDDRECTSGICWDWSDYDPFCFGAVCSGACAMDEECVTLATDAAAPYPDLAYCGDDGLCVLLESGLGAWACQ